MKPEVVNCNMGRNLLWIVILMGIAGCNSSKKEPALEVLALKEMSELVTVEYVVNKIIKANDDKTWYKVGDRKILMTCEATLKAGIDFSKITADNVVIDGKNITLYLPHAQLFSLNIRPEDIKIAYQEVSLFRSPFSNEEKAALTVQAEKQLRNSADSLGVLQTAETNGALFVSKFLQQLGYEQINIQFGKNGAQQKIN